ncbi:MAG: IS200/IS605 family transposase [Chloroflexi bacterium]|nr:IS200/IS605 family transposase [Chloroflexota bacterium]
MGKTCRTGHAVYRLHYHFVWIPKYRVKVLKGAIAERAKEIFQETATHYEFEMDTLEVMADHVHLFLSAPPRYAPARIANILKSISAKKLFEEFPQIRKVLWHSKLWADGYYVGSSGDEVTADMIRRYIHYQQVQQKQLRLF